MEQHEWEELELKELDQKLLFFCNEAATYGRLEVI